MAPPLWPVFLLAYVPQPQETCLIYWLGLYLPPLGTALGGTPAGLSATCAHSRGHQKHSVPLAP